MNNIIVFTQNLKLDSLSQIAHKLDEGKIILFSSHCLFENEKNKIERIFNRKCIILNFSDIMNDEKYEHCDLVSYSLCDGTLSSYYDKIKEIKNTIAADFLLNTYRCDKKIVLCDDLGIAKNVWIEKGFIEYKLDYYFISKSVKNSQRHLINRFFAIFTGCYNRYNAPIYKAYYKGNKYLFWGSLNRILYRMNLQFTEASFIEHINYAFLPLMFKIFKWLPKSKVIRMTTLHESTKYFIPNHPNIHKKIIQDGYLPPNYPSKYLLFNSQFVEFYTWDSLGQLIFKYHNLPSKILPFRKKIYMPKPNYPHKVKKVLCVASGAGDWTAVKNRSDEDKMIIAFGKVASLCPDIEFIYRCHPVWVHPSHQGVNSIIRAAEYIDWLNLPNFKISCNIPSAKDDSGHYILSYKRSSFEDDIEGVDIVFGEHSISMIDAGFKNIPFCSVNVTGRRDFFEGITRMGFPHCESVNEILNVLNAITTQNFIMDYDRAVYNYNLMTDEEN